MGPGLAAGSLPDAAPLAMPTQSLRGALPRAPKPGGRLASSPRLVGLRRLVVIGPAIVLTGFAAREMYRVLAVNGVTPLAVFMLALFVALFAWIALSFTSAIAGFVSIVGGGGRRLLAPGGRRQLTPGERPRSRTALLMPTYNESPTRTMAGLEAIDEELRRLGVSDCFDIFILSDTTQPEIWIEEEKAFVDLRARTGGRRGFSTGTERRIRRARPATSPNGSTRFGGAYDSC